MNRIYQQLILLLTCLPALNAYASTNNVQSITVTEMVVELKGDEPSQHFRLITENTLLRTDVGTIEQEKENEDWIEGGTYGTDKKGTIDPVTGLSGTGVVANGVILKRGNSEKKLTTRVTGIEAVWAYGCTAGGTDRDLVVTVSDANGNVVATARATSTNFQSVVVRIGGLDTGQNYSIEYTGCAPGEDSGSDVVLHGVRFLRKDFTEKCFLEGQLWYHTLSDEAVEVVGHENIVAKHFTMPAQVSFEGRSYTVEAIALQGMGACWDVEQLTLPASLKHLGYQSFVWSGYTQINIPASVTAIEGQCFIACGSLKTITVDPANANYVSDGGVLFNKDKTELICYPAGIAKSWYDIPSTVTTLDVSAFHSCSSLEYVQLPDQLENAWWELFEGCENLTTVVALRPEPATSWSESSFADAAYAKATLWVPEASVESYRQTAPWNRFKAVKAIPATLTVTASNATITYGDKLPANYSYTISDGPYCGQPVLSCGASDVSMAGSYAIVVVKGTLHTPCQTVLNRGTLTIRKAPLTVSVGNYTKKQGDPMPDFKVVYSGFVNGQNEQVLTKKAVTQCEANATSAPGTYPITVSGAASENYDFTYRNGQLTVVAADAIVVTAKSYTVYYGDALPNFTYDVTGGQLNGKPQIVCDASKPSPGVYDIVVSRGSMTNFNVSYVNGTLTVLRAPLSVSVGNYEKFSNEENPPFTLSYEGFKYGENAASLTRQPTAHCEARIGSPAGKYPITISGGESPNYQFSYHDGTLTVKSIFSLNISVTGKGKVVYNGSDIASFGRYGVEQGQQVMLSLVPDEGYQLESLLMNGRNVTKDVVNDTYTIPSVSEDLIIVATFGERQGAFTVGGIRYAILSAPDRTVMVDKGPAYEGHLTVPLTVEYGGNIWHVEGVADQTFADCKRLISVSLPGSLKSAFVGSSLFTGCQGLAAITWNAGFPMTTAMLGVVDNPNLLFYTAYSHLAPPTIHNVVTAGTAADIVLSDVAGAGGNFYCPTAFLAGKVTYTHHYGMATPIGGVAGWETLALPFTVGSITHEVQGTIVPFAAYHGEDYPRPFWLYTYGPAGFTRASTIMANTPYIISMPNNAAYDAQFIMAGQVTFEARNAIIQATPNAVVQQRGEKRFVPAFCMEDQSARVYALNVVNQVNDNDAGLTPGSTFVSNLRTVSPFEAYMTSGTAGARTIEIDFDQASAIADLEMLAGNKTFRMPCTVYNLSGQQMGKANSNLELQTLMKRLPAGIYMINGKKIQK